MEKFTMDYFPGIMCKCKLTSYLYNELTDISNSSGTDLMCSNIENKMSDGPCPECFTSELTLSPL